MRLNSLYVQLLLPIFTNIYIFFFFWITHAARNWCESTKSIGKKIECPPNPRGIWTPRIVVKRFVVHLLLLSIFFSLICICNLQVSGMPASLKCTNWFNIGIFVVYHTCHAYYHIVPVHIPKANTVNAKFELDTFPTSGLIIGYSMNHCGRDCRDVLVFESVGDNNQWRKRRTDGFLIVSTSEGLV